MMNYFTILILIVMFFFKIKEGIKEMLIQMLAGLYVISLHQLSYGYVK